METEFIIKLLRNHVDGIDTSVIKIHLRKIIRIKRPPGNWTYFFDCSSLEFAPQQLVNFIGAQTGFNPLR